MCVFVPVFSLFCLQRQCDTYIFFFRCAIDYASFLFSWEERQHAVDGDFESGLGAV